jgi:DNA primase
MAFPSGFLDEIKNRVATSDVVGRKVKLQRRGREFVGLSPFKQERTPSFTVNDDKQFYHCFSTGKHGSIFDFVMETEGLSFPEAVERLASEAGLPMPERDPRAAERAQRQAGLVDVTEAAAKWFQAQLQTPAADDARAYLERRGVTQDMIAAFGVGYAPRSRTALLEHLTARNMGVDKVIESGMAIKPDDNKAPYDRFRDRIVFPITDTRGRVIAFGGRAMQADAPAKYLNSPDTPLFDKGRILYNFARARQPAYDTGTLLVAEGYMDVVGLAHAGFHHAVAPMGTALTEEQIQLAWRMAPEPILCLDGDQAGLRAAYRAIDRALPLLKPGYSLRFAILPPGKDPDDVVREGGAEAMQAILGKAMSLLDLMWEREIEAAPWDTPERAAALKKRLREAVNQVRDGDVKTLYGQEIRKRLDKLLGNEALPNRNYQQGGGRNTGWQNRGSRPAYRGQPTSEVRRSALATGADDWLPREALIVLIAFHHPAVLLTYRDMFEAMTLKSAALDAMRYEIIDYFDGLGAHDVTAAGLDNAGLTRHLEGRGRQDVSARLAKMPEARRLSFARLDADLEEVLAGWLEVSQLHHKLLTLAVEQQQAEAELESELKREEGDSQDALDRLLAIKNEIAALEQQNSSAV